MGEPPGPIESIRTRAAGDLVVLAVLAVGIVSYCVDAIRASTAVLNLILVLPLSIAVFALCFAAFLISLRESRVRDPGTASPEALAATVPASADPPESAAAPASVRPAAAPGSDMLRVIGLFTVYVLTLPWLGFDVGTSLFIAGFLWLHGERRWPWLLGYSIGFGFLTALFFSGMLPYPMPMLLLGAA